jgi:hypothetical protein
MAITVTLDQLISRARFNADVTNAPTPTDATVEGMINAGLRDLYAHLCSGAGEFLSESVDLITSSGVGTYTLPSDFWQLRGVTWEIDDDNAAPIYRFESRDRARLVGRTWGARARYRLADVAMGGAPTIEFLPAPDGTYTVRVDYIPDPPTISDTIPLTCASGMDDYLVLYATIQILGAEESDVTLWEARRQEALRVCMLSVSLRDENRSATISDGDADEAGVWWW